MDTVALSSVKTLIRCLLKNVLASVMVPAVLCFWLCFRWLHCSTRQVKPRVGVIFLLSSFNTSMHPVEEVMRASAFSNDTAMLSLSGLPTSRLFLSLLYFLNSVYFFSPFGISAGSISITVSVRYFLSVCCGYVWTLMHTHCNVVSRIHKWIIQANLTVLATGIGVHISIL